VLLLGAGTTGAFALHHLDGNIRSVDVSAGLGNDRPAPRLRRSSEMFILRKRVPVVA